MNKSIKFLIKEPLFHFAFISLSLYVIYYTIAPQKQDKIIVSQQTIQALVANRSYLLNRDLNEVEKQQLINEFINEEILIKEAQKQNIPETNTRIRKMIIDEMRMVLDEEPPEPTKADLEKTLQDNKEKFKPSLIFSFNHIYYRFNSPKYLENQATISKELKDKQNFKSLGDTFMLGNTLDGYNENELKAIFGIDFVQEIKQLKIKDWSQPIKSSQGIHLVQITKKSTSTTPNWQTIEPYLREIWKLTQRKQIQQQKLEKLRQQYLIKVEKK